jgi:nucleoside-specific outer membrane channel protein Tsx
MSQQCESNRRHFRAWARDLALVLVLGASAGNGLAEDFSDTSIGWRFGTKFGEPFEGNDIHKNVIDFQHGSSYRYGTNFFNVDLLLSDKRDPGQSGEGAQEAYVAYRNTVDAGKVFNKELAYGGIVRGLGATLGFDWNTKNDALHASKKRLLVAGPTVMVDVPGFLNISVLESWESNAPNGVAERYYYDSYPMLDIVWGIPIGDSPFIWQGYFDYAASKGKDEYGGDTAPESHADTQIMLDVGRVLGGAKNTFKVGLEYEYWRNKYGTNHFGPAGSGAFAKTPLIRAEYHF